MKDDRGLEWVAHFMSCMRANDAVDALVRIIWTVVPLAAAQQYGEHIGYESGVIETLKGLK